MHSDRSSDLEQTFLFADLAGFTALTEVHGDAQAADLAEDFCRRIASLANSYGAETIKTIGDAVMIRVGIARDSIGMGLAINHQLGELEGYPAIRVGMHSGPAVERAGDWFGSAVNLAARVAATAGGGEVLVTDATRAAAGPMEEVEIETLGERRFKNVAAPVALFLVRSRGGGRGGVEIDPVCRMVIATGRRAGTLTFDGETYSFCSLECARAFASAPERFSTMASVRASQALRSDD